MTQTTDLGYLEESLSSGLSAGEPADLLMTRVNSLVGRRLAGPDFRRVIASLAAAEARCAELADLACDELYVLGGTVAGRQRGEVLALRRAIHNNRRVEAIPTGCASLPAVAAWFDAKTRAELAGTAVESGYPTFLARERVALAEMVGNESLRLSLALNSPQVLEAVQRYRRSGGDPSPRDRKSERGILQFLTRALIRVSPLSRFTAVGFATWSESAPSMDDPRLTRRQGRSRIHLDRALFVNAISGIVEPPGAAAAPNTVRRNPSLRMERESIRFQHWADGARRSLGAGLTDDLRTLLELTAMGPVDAHLLVRALTDGGTDRGTAERLVAGAVAAQILVGGPVYDEQTDDPLPVAVELLAGYPDARRIVTGLRGDLAVVADAPVAQRSAALARIRSAEAELNRLTSRPARVQVNEDSLLDPIAVSARGYQQALDDLTAVAAFHGAMDRHHLVRALMVRAFVDRFGPGGTAHLMSCASWMVATVYEREARLRLATAAELGPADGSLTDLLTLRSTVTSVLRRQILDADPRAEVVVDPGWMDGVVRALPERFVGTGSYGLLVQPLDGRLVLNGCYNGHGLVATRFLHADQDGVGVGAAQRIRDRIERIYGGEGIRLVEDRGLHLSNINHHAQILDDVCTPDEWLQLRLRHDVTTDRLALVDEQGREVRVFSLGMKWLELQPDPLRVAVWLHDTGRVSIDPVTHAHAARTGSAAVATPPTDGPAGRPTVAYPRVVAGSVVLVRRRWYPGDDFPGPDPADEAGHLLAITRWRARHGVPEEVVAKTHLGSPTMAATGANAAEILGQRRREKPQYLDLASALLVRVLPKMLERRASGYLEEALPGVRAGVQASEWALDIDFPPARPRSSEVAGRR
jgi:hypothetical protein